MNIKDIKLIKIAVEFQSKYYTMNLDGFHYWFQFFYEKMEGRENESFEFHFELSDHLLEQIGVIEMSLKQPEAKRIFQFQDKKVKEVVREVSDYVQFHKLTFGNRLFTFLHIPEDEMHRVAEVMYYYKISEYIKSGLRHDEFEIIISAMVDCMKQAQQMDQ